MATVVYRFERSRIKPSLGYIYYRIYKGHTSKVEFSSKIRLSVDEWDVRKKDFREDNERIAAIRHQIDFDIEILYKIIAAFDKKRKFYTAGDVMKEFKEIRKKFNVEL